MPINPKPAGCKIKLEGAGNKTPAPAVGSGSTIVLTGIISPVNCNDLGSALPARPNFLCSPSNFSGTCFLLICVGCCGSFSSFLGPETLTLSVLVAPDTGIDSFFVLAAVPGRESKLEAVTEPATSAFTPKTKRCTDEPDAPPRLA